MVASIGSSAGGEAGNEYPRRGGSSGEDVLALDGSSAGGAHGGSLALMRRTEAGGGSFFGPGSWESQCSNRTLVRRKAGLSGA